MNIRKRKRANASSTVCIKHWTIEGVNGKNGKPTTFCARAPKRKIYTFMRKKMLMFVRVENMRIVDGFWVNCDAKRDKP